MVRSLIMTFCLLMTGSSAALAGTNDFEGRWQFTSSQPAPWADPKLPPMASDDALFENHPIVIGADSIDGPDMLNCGKTALSVDGLPYAGLFECGLAVEPGNPAAAPDEAKAKRLAIDLGFTREPVPTLSQGCSEILLHLRDPNTIMIGLDNRIYSFQRQ